MTDTNTKKVTTYSPEDVKTLVELYDGGNGKPTKEIAEIMNRAPRSITGKLVSMGLYVKPVVAPKTFVDTGPSKKDTLARLKALGFTEETLKGLGNATKGALEVVADRLEAAKAPAEAPEAVEQVA